MSLAARNRLSGKKNNAVKEYVDLSGLYQTMTKKPLRLFARLQILFGLACWFGIIWILTRPEVGMSAIWIPGLALLGLMLLPALALLTGRRWAYYGQIIAALLVGGGVFWYYSYLFRGQSWPYLYLLVFWGLTIGPMFLPGIRHYFHSG